LAALAFGLDEREMQLGKAIIDPKPMLRSKGLL
jgi:hypothetical protein